MHSLKIIGEYINHYNYWECSVQLSASPSKVHLNSHIFQYFINFNKLDKDANSKDYFFCNSEAARVAARFH